MALPHRAQRGGGPFPGHEAVGGPGRGRVDPRPGGHREDGERQAGDPGDVRRDSQVAGGPGGSPGPQVCRGPQRIRDGDDTGQEGSHGQGAAVQRHQEPEAEAGGPAVSMMDEKKDLDLIERIRSVDRYRPRAMFRVKVALASRLPSFGMALAGSKSPRLGWGPQPGWTRPVKVVAAAAMALLVGILIFSGLVAASSGS